MPTCTCVLAKRLTPPFVPYPPDSLRQSEDSESDSNYEPSRLHYSKVWLSALRLGYTRKELAVMPYGEIIFDLAAMNEDKPTKQEKEPDVVDATQEDIRTMLG